MRILDAETRLEIEKPDLSAGYLCETEIIRPDASPIDNVNKFAYSDADYERVQLYHKREPEEQKKPTPDERLTALEGKVEGMEQWEKAFRKGVQQA